MLKGTESIQPQLDSTIKHINAEMVKLPPLQRISAPKRKSFAIDLALIGLSIRTGYLVDVTASQPDIFSRLVAGLRQTCPPFEAVTHIYEPTSNQSFFVNMRMLKRYVSDNIPSCLHHMCMCETSFIYLGTDIPFKLLIGPPFDFFTLLQFLVNKVELAQPISITLPSDLVPETVIPLAAFLLEYPVAYVPASNQSSFLSNIPLDVYECVLTFDGSSRMVPKYHTLLKFSLPSDLAKEEPDKLDSSYIVGNLTKKFTDRLLSAIPKTTVQVLQSTQTLDRVAL